MKKERGNRTYLARISQHIGGTGLAACLLANFASAQPSIPRVNEVFLDEQRDFHLLLEGSASDYYTVFESSDLDSFDDAVMLKLGENREQEFVLDPADPPGGKMFYRVESKAQNNPDDQDGDGIHDVFELQNARTLDPLNPIDALRDADGDGRNNREEFQAGTLLTTADNQGRSLETKLRIETPFSYPTGQRPQAIALGDLNGDRLPDVVAANDGDDEITVHLASAEGFASPQSYSVGSAPSALSIADIDLDGVRDVLVASRGADRLQIFLNNGDGTLQGQTPVSAPGDPVDITTQFLDSGSTRDVILANADSNSLSLFYGKSGGGFEPAVSVGLGANQSAVAVGQLDGKSFLEIAAAETATGRIALLTMQSDGTFTVLKRIDTGGSMIGDLDLGDLEGDGDTDIVVTLDGTEDAIVFYKNDGQASFTESGRENTGDAPRDVWITDFNGDGSPDAITANHLSSDLTVALNDGLGGIESTSTIETIGDPSAIAVGDIDGDGSADAAVAHDEANRFSVLLGLGNGNFRGAAQRFEAGRQITDIIAGRFDGDGTADLVVDGLTSLAGLGNGGFEAPTDLPGVTLDGSAAAFQAGDFNNDDVTDIAVATAPFFGEVEVRVLLQQSDGSFAAQSPVTVGPQLAFGTDHVALALGDFNQDDKLDAAAANKEAQAIHILLGDGAGGFAANPTVLSADNNVDSIATGRIDDNSSLDLVVSNTSNGLYLGDNSGAFSLTSDAVLVQGGPVALADMNGDGASDIVSAVPFADTVKVHINQGDGSFAFPASYGAGESPEDLVLGDINQDGYTDVATANKDSNDVSILLGNPDGTLRPQQRFPAGASPVALALRNFDGGYGPDIAVANQFSEDISILSRRGISIYEAPEAVVQAMETLAGQMRSMIENGDSPKTVEQWIAQQSDVREAGSGSGLVSFRLKDGPRAFVFDAPPPMGSSTSTTAAVRAANSRSSGGGGTNLAGDSDNREAKSALVLAPFNQRYGGGDVIRQAVASIRGYATRTVLLPDSAAGVHAFTSWASRGYDYIHVDSLGGVVEYENEQGDKVRDTVVATGQPIDENLESLFTRFPDATVYHVFFLSDVPDPVIGLGDSFFTKRYFPKLRETTLLFNGVGGMESLDSLGAVPGADDRIISPQLGTAFTGSTLPLLAVPSNNFMSWSTPVNPVAALSPISLLLAEADRTGHPFDKLLEDLQPSAATHLNSGSGELRLAAPATGGRRIRETIKMLHPVSLSQELALFDNYPIMGVPGDALPDDIPIHVHVDGVLDNEKENYIIEVFANGVITDAFSFSQADEVTQVGTDSYRLRYNAQLFFPAEQAQVVDIGVRTLLPNGEYTSHRYAKNTTFLSKLKVILANPALQVDSYVSDTGNGFAQPDEATVMARLPLELKRIENNTELIFVGGGPKTWSFGPFIGVRDGAVGPIQIPSICQTSDSEAAMEMIGEIRIPFTSGEYKQEGIGQPGEWIFAGDNCDVEGIGSRDPPCLEQLWGLQMAVLHSDAAPPRSEVEGRTELPIDQFNVIFRIKNWTEGGERVWQRSKVVDNATITEDTRMAFEFPGESGQ